MEQHKQQQHLRAIPRGACLIPRVLSDRELCFEGVSLRKMCPLVPEVQASKKILENIRQSNPKASQKPPKRLPKSIIKSKRIVSRCLRGPQEALRVLPEQVLAIFLCFLLILWSILSSKGAQDGPSWAQKAPKKAHKAAKQWSKTMLLAKNRFFEKVAKVL